MQIDLAYFNTLLAQWFDYLYHHHLYALILAVLITAMSIWVILKIFYRFKLKKLGNRLGLEIAAKEKECAQLNEFLETAKKQLEQAEVDLGVKNNQIEQLENTKHVLLEQVDQLNRVKALIIQSSQTLQTNFSFNEFVAMNHDDNVDNLWQKYSSITNELNQRLKSYERQNIELQQLNQQSVAKLAEQEITIVNLEESVKNHTSNLDKLKQEFEIQKLTLEERLKAVESSQRVKETIQENRFVQEPLKAIEEPTEPLATEVQPLEQFGEALVDQVQAIEESVQTIVSEKIMPVIESSLTEAEEIIESVTSKKKQGFQLLNTLKKTLHIGEKSVVNEDLPIAAETDTEQEVSERDRFSEQSILNQLQEEKHVQHSTAEAIESSPVEKTSVLPKLKSFFGKKTNESTDNIESTASFENARENISTSDIDAPKSEEKTGGFTKLKSIFGAKKNSENDADVIQQENAGLLNEIDNQAPKESPVVSKLKGFFGKNKNAIADEPEDGQEVIETLDETSGQLKGFLRKLKITK